MKAEILCGTVDGILHNLNDLRPENIRIETIATGLSNQCRYNGQVKKFYSVAEHCVLITRLIREIWGDNRVTGLELQRQALMHDAPEAYIGDVIHGLKTTLPDFVALDDELLKKIFTAFGLEYNTLDNFINHIDREVCKDEMLQLMPVTHPYLLNWIGNGSAFKLKVKNWSPKKAKKEFMKEVKRLNIRSQYEQNISI